MATYAFLDEMLNAHDSLAREQRQSDVSPLLGLIIVAQRQRRLLGRDQMVQADVLGPSILGVVDLVVYRWFGKVKLEHREVWR